MTACSCPTPHLPGESTRCYQCGLQTPLRTRVVPIDPSFGMLDGEDDGTVLDGDQLLAKMEARSSGYVASVLSTVDAFTAAGLKVKTVRCGFLLFAECRAKVGAKVEIGVSWFERDGVRFVYDQEAGAYGLAIGAEAG